MYVYCYKTATKLLMSAAALSTIHALPASAAASVKST